MDLHAAEETITALEKEIPRLEEVNMEVHRLREEKVAWEMERTHLMELMDQSPAKENLEAAVSTLRLMAQDFGIGLVSHEPSLLGLIEAVARHLQLMQVRLKECGGAKDEWESTKMKLEDEVRMGAHKHEALSMELEEVRKERDAFRRDSPSLDIRSRVFTWFNTPGHCSCFFFFAVTQSPTCSFYQLWLF
jgi:chromosome segregation ATPase